jgi:(p)ppGpp synthase/HD superfamily hydrolase
MGVLIFCVPRNYYHRGHGQRKRKMTDDHQKRQILMANLERAIEIAVLAHKGASDKSGAPYILHPLRLMFGIEDIEAKIVAVLHDVVEDSKPPYRWGLQELEAEGFSANVIEALDCVTKRPDEPYEAFIERILPNPIADRVKIADLLDNMSLVRLGREITEKDVARLRKYQRALARLTKQSLFPE